MCPNEAACGGVFGSLQNLGVVVELSKQLLNLEHRSDAMDFNCQLRTVRAKDFLHACQNFCFCALDIELN